MLTSIWGVYRDSQKSLDKLQSMGDNSYKYTLAALNYSKCAEINICFSDFFRKRFF